jgi:O-antigen/teichoic acid export membrane protein
LYSQYGYFAITGANKILLLMAFFPIGRLYIDILQVYYRASQQNNLFAKFTITTNITLLIINIISTYKYGLNGLIIGTYITYILVFIISFKLLNILEIVQLNNNDINTKEFIKFSSYNVFATAFSQIIFILDIILLGYIIHDTKLIAIYKIATTIPFALNFIPGVIVSYYYPIITKIKQEQKSVKNFMHKLQIKMFGLTLLISTILIITAKPLIILIWGTKYISAITPFRILMIGYPLIACGRIIYGMILAIYGKVSFSMWLNIILLFINLLSTYFLITHYNIIGAALGILFIYFISSLISAYVVYNIIK